MPDFTAQQQQAILDHTHNLIVVAGAGSGKTRVLVERYLALLDAHPDWPLNAIVAITFTRKAAAEMRDRVRQSLEKRYREDSANSARWSALLAQMDTARIGTIHGLCADILRANAAQAALDPAFVVMEETDAAILIDHVISDLIDSLLNDQNSADPELLALFSAYDNPNKIRDVLSDPAILSADLPAPRDWLAHWSQQWDEAIRTAINRLKASAEFMDAARWTPPAGLPPDDKLLQVWQIASTARHQLLDADDTETIYSAMECIANEIKLTGGSKKAWGEDALEEVKRILKALRETVSDFIKAHPRIGDRDANAAQLLNAWIKLVGLAQAAYRTAKEAASALDFDDLESRTRDLLAQHPEARARYQGIEFKHVMVDEFQDTNARQWAIVQQLADVKRGGSLFVVGDPKQSIYAFRGADVSVFDITRQQIIGAGGRDIPLATSFRTHAPLVSRFNDLFGALLQRDESSAVAAWQVEYGEPMQAHRSEAPTGEPCIEIHVIDESKIEKTRASTRDKVREWEAYALAQRLKTLIEIEQRMVYDRHSDTMRPARYGDVAVLLRAMTNVRKYEDALRSAGIPFITVAGRGYYGRQEVQDLLYLLEAVEDPSNDLALAVVLRSPLFALSDDALLRLRWPHTPPPPLRTALVSHADQLAPEDAARARFADETLAALESLAGRVTLSELLREALNRTGYLATISAVPDGVQKRSNIEKLLEVAQRSGRVTLPAFTHYLRDLSVREAREGDAPLEPGDVVQIMTVHKSKGLEFPIVVLADAQNKGGRNDSPLLVLDNDLPACKLENADPDDKTVPFAYTLNRSLASQREDAESLRLLYVALTRAMDLVIVSGAAKQGDEGKTSATGWLGMLIGDKGGLTDDIPELKIALHDVPPTPDLLAPRSDRPAAGLTLPDVPPLMPPLMKRIRIHREAQARHLSATLIADLGSAENRAAGSVERQRSRSRFRRKVIHDAPDTIPSVLDSNQALLPRQIGDMVHRALQFWRVPNGMPDNDYPLRDMLRSHAIELHLPPVYINEAINKAYGYLHQFTKSALYTEIEQAQNVQREVPFIYRIQDHIIHGVIDVLYQLPDGQWVIADYKTSAPGKGVDVRTHAERYHLQVGIYAEALRAYFDKSQQVMPIVKIHYLLVNETVVISPEQWKSALDSSQLSERIQRVLLED